MITHHERSICQKVIATHLTGVRETTLARALQGTQCKHTQLVLPWLSLCSFLSNVFQTQSPSHLIRNLAHPLFYSVSLYFVLVSHPVDRPTSKITQVSTSVESSAKNIICAKWSDECSERTGCLSSRTTKKNNWNLKQNWWYQRVFFGFPSFISW